MGVPSGERGSAGRWSLLWPPHHWGRLGPLFFLGAQSPRTTEGSKAWAVAPTALCPSPPRSQMDSRASLCWVLSPPCPYLPPPGSPPVLLSPRDPASLSSALPTEGHPRGGSPRLSRDDSLTHQELHRACFCRTLEPRAPQYVSYPLSTLDGCDSRRGSICSRTQIWGSSDRQMESSFQFVDKNSHAGTKSVPESAQAAPGQAAIPLYE